MQGLDLALGALEQKVLALKRTPIIGLGSGRTASKVLKELGKRLNDKGIKPIGVATSAQIKFEVSDFFLISEPIFDTLDVVVDGADQVSSYNGYVIKGGGGALTKERIVWEISKERHVFVSKEKVVEKLDHPLPLEFLPFAYTLVKSKILKLGLTPNLRVDARGYPFITENGNYIFDINYPESYDLKGLYEDLVKTPGVLDVGLFIYDLNLHVV